MRLPVVLYLPNIIGYMRIVLSTLSVRFHTSPHTFLTLYTFSFILDAFDGLAARAFAQHSSFGALLDMLTDRISTCTLLTLISAHHRPSAVLALPLAFLDGYSHFLQFAAALAAGTSHKSAARGRVLNLYYSRPVLTFVCTGNELAFIAYYMIISHAPGPVVALPLVPPAPLANVLFAAALPVCILKQAVSVRQIFSAHYTIRDAIAASRKPP